MEKSIHFAVYLSKLDEFELKELSDRKYIAMGEIISVGDNRYDITGGCDRSDVAQLNIELEHNKLKEIIPLNGGHYTHIVLDSDDYYFAVVIKEGDWTENYS